MGAIVQILFTLVGLVLLGLALWFSITIIGFFILAGIALAVFLWLKNFLIQKGILNPTPGVPMDHSPTVTDNPPTVTVIDASFTRVDELEKK